MRISRILAALPLLASCALSRGQVSSLAPDLLPEWDRSIQLEDELKSRLPELELAAAEAVASPDPSDDLPAAEALARANEALQKVEAPLAEIERKVLERTGAQVAGPLNALHPALGALAMAAVPLIGRRGRKLYSSALRSASKGQLLVSAADLLKVLAGLHSSPQPQSQPMSESSGGAVVVELKLDSPPDAPQA
jgi:hypothetical protein